MKIKYDDWLKILQQTVQESNWSHLHSHLKSENTKFLILKNYIDEIQDAMMIWELYMQRTKIEGVFKFCNGSRI